MHLTFKHTLLFFCLVFVSGLASAQTPQRGESSDSVAYVAKALIPFWQTQSSVASADTLVYDVKKDLSVIGGNILEVMIKIPLLSVDGSGQVCIRGNNKVRILIDGKPSTLLNISEALKQIQGESVQYIEVIRIPHLRYDAEGAAGIVNIVTKKSDLAGLSLSINGAAGYRPSGLGVRGNYKKGRSNLNINFGIRSDFFEAKYTQKTGVNSVPGFFAISHSDTEKGLRLFKNFGINYTYEFKRNSYLSGGLTYYHSRVSGYLQRTTSVYSDGQETGKHNAETDVLARVNTPDLHLDYLKLFKFGGRFSISAFYSQSAFARDADPFRENLDPRLKNSINTHQHNFHENFIQSDFSMPIRKNQQLEIGAKRYSRSVRWRNTFSRILTSGKEYEDFDSFGHFHNQLSAYLNYSLRLAEWSVELGARYELIKNAALEGRIENAGYWNFGVLNPAASLNKKLGEKLKFNLNYWRRSQRVEENQFAIVMGVTNNSIFHELNLDVRPEISDNLEVGVNQIIAKGNHNLAVFGRLTQNLLIMNSSIDEMFSGKSNVWHNDGKQSDLGLSYNFNYRIIPALSIAGGTDIVNKRIKGRFIREDADSEIKKDDWYWGSRLLLQYEMPKQWGFQVNLNRSGRQVDFLSVLEPVTRYAVGIRKSCNQKRTSFGIIAENFFRNESSVNLDIGTPMGNTTNTFFLRDRNIRITFSHQFGS